MLLEFVEKLGKEDLLSDELFAELFAIEDDISRTRKYYELEALSMKLRCQSQFKKIYGLYNRRFKSEKKATIIETESNFSVDFPEKDISYNSGVWQLDETGIYTISDKGRDYACYHPIFPKGILKSAESGLCKTMLCFKVRGCWTEIAVGREILASASKIVALAQYGVQVTSENAKSLVRYLNDIEALNEDCITDHVSTSKLGWIGENFMPYSSSEIVFDNDPKLMSLFRSIKEYGNREKWYNLAKKIRADGHIEVLIYMAASLASVLVEPCGALPFIVSLWGGTGLGKTVALMVATSIWADPSEGAYMTDAKATPTAMEIRLDALNSLPMTLDDMAQIRTQDDDFSSLIYRWCAGKGRDRSNQSLGLNPLTKWANCTLTNGERSLVTDLMQGGAANRVIDIEIAEAMFKNGNTTSKTLRSNYGFCGKEFVQVIQNIGFEEVNTRFEGWMEKLKKLSIEEKEDKQIAPMALILTADELSEEYLYKDGIKLDPIKCLGYLKNKNDISENKRAYEYLKDMVFSHQAQFEPDDNGEYRFGCWGSWLKDDKVAILPSIFNKLLQEGNFQNKAFLSWAQRNNLLEKESKGWKKVSICGKRIRCVIIDLSRDLDSNTDFIEVSEADMDDIPFN